MVTGIGLFSGGLDSILAVRVLQEQGINVIAVCFVTPFFGPEKAQAAADHLGIPLQIIDITEAHVTMLKNPRYGYGRYLNPCIDCHGLMFRQASALMETTGAQFLFSGEVLGERPMSQNKNSLRAVEKLSGVPGYILRPLSAVLLPETIPEQQGWVDRAKLYAISGRSRKPQLELARRFGITQFPEPAGGCRLTEPGFSKRLRELLDHTETITKRDLELLKIGRHLRLPNSAKVIIGRNKKENSMLRTMAGDHDIVLSVQNIPGPTALMLGPVNEEELIRAASLCARYGDVVNSAKVRVMVRLGKTQRVVQVVPADEGTVRGCMI